MDARRVVPWTAVITAFGALGALIADESGLIPITREQWYAIEVVGTLPLLGLMIYSVVMNIASDHESARRKAEREKSPHRGH